ncbi:MULTISPECIES: spore coat protein [Clostridium]|uniref:Coat F domain protein n=3 Tax=Clostridium TaxID=1485 RepID=D8GPE9_CLOLD|nr:MULTISPECIES: spore coat protein [Clostridium]ADK16027.1 predicted spore coat protein F [Clostridium ljungdahlii DSM 13528]AGY75203.1 spore coat protein [Clostridium autoethanogenum DSM 10061]ALU35373.1 Coat F domain protein [Clostridium autoethanogenum DSM 10061]OAA87097.1 Coat F domain protein [Clostridium ljungdahlii DSM 13528]OVY49548.1 Coat F domain protein [Clostridium autoethanogenum]
MQLAAHEIHDLHELTISCVNSITNMAMFINAVQDQELKSMIQAHFPAHIQDYNIKVEYLSKTTGPTQKLNVPSLVKTLQDYTKSPTNNFPSITPRTDIQQMNDREIATAYLLTLKRAGREYAWSAMEASNPGVREFLKDAFTMSCNHAYEVWQYMVKKGYYPLEPAPESTINTMSSIYKEVRQPSLV